MANNRSPEHYESLTLSVVIETQCFCIFLIDIVQLLHGKNVTSIRSKKKIAVMVCTLRNKQDVLFS